MRIESIDIKGFGCLGCRRYEFPQDKAVLVVEENETGKSTLAAAILAGLCGFPSRKRRQDPMKLSEIYRPWDGGGYGLEMVLGTQQKRWRVERDFDRDQFAVRDVRTNQDSSASFHEDLAYHFLKLDRDDFSRVAFITGKEVQEFGKSTTIQDRLSALVEGSEDESSAAAAVGALDKATCVVGNSGNILLKTAITRLTAELDEKKRRMAELDGSLDAAGAEVQQLDQAKSQHKERQARLAELDAEYGSARLAEIRDKIESAAGDLAEAERLREELSGLERYAAFPVDRAEQLTKASALIKERRDKLRSLEDESKRLASESDELKVRIEKEESLKTAAQDDLVRMEACGAQVRNAREMVDRCRPQAGPQKRGLSGALFVLGIAAALASGIAFLAGLISAVGAGVGFGAGAVIAAVGYWQSQQDGNAAARFDQARDSLRQAEAEAARALRAIGVEEPEVDDLLDALERAKKRVAQYLNDTEKHANTQTKLLALERDIADTKRRIDDEQKVARTILTDAGIDTSLELSDAVKEFAAAEGNYRRYRQLKNSDLPSVEKRLIPQAELERLRQEEVQLAQTAGELEEGAPARPLVEVERDRQAVRTELDDLNTRIRNLDHSVGTCVDEYRREYPLLQEEEKTLRGELDKVLRFKQAVETAARVIGEAAESSHQRWAGALNQEAAEILPHLNPDYDTLLFDDTLGFSVRHKQTDRVVQKDEIDAMLSTGAKDQIYLAVRLACCTELSDAGEAIPIILDDPFVASDDVRFREGLKYLVEHAAKEHQIIILTCHRSRHEKLSSEEWFRNGVHTLEI